jgi:very-short-patch-repair endonuclease
MPDYSETEFVQSHLSRALSRWRDENIPYILRSASSTHSPLEAAFVVWWLIIGKEFGDASLRAQVPITTTRTTYRVDFLAAPSLALLEDPTPSSCVLIELDGHAFHERSKRDVERRNVRDRDLQDTGWKVLHFSGSEFDRAPESVIESVHQALRRHVARF